MASVKIETTISCEVDTSEEAHQLGKELEDRLHASITQLLPNLRYSECINTGTIRFKLEIEGRRVTISSTQEKKK
jgi:hypothetical protein